MASYPVPILHEGVLNSVFNHSDFNYGSLTTTNVSGNLNVSRLGVIYSGIQINGSHVINGSLTCTGNSSVGSLSPMYTVSTSTRRNA